MDQTFAQLSCMLIGLKLQQAAKLPDADAAKELLQTARQLRDTLITLGMRKRKSRKPKGEVSATSEEPKPKRGRK